MIPGCEEILRLAQEYDTIPVCREIYADVVTPITLLRRIAGRSRRFFLLESVEGGEKWGRYSFLGCDPVLRVTLKNGRVVTEQADGTKTETETNRPYDILREIFKDRAPQGSRAAGRSAGGFVGYFASHDGYAEPTLTISRGGEQDFDLMLFDEVIAYDHLKQKISVVVNQETGDKAPETLLGAYGKACGGRSHRSYDPGFQPAAGERAGQGKGFCQQLFQRGILPQGGENQGVHPKRRHFPGRDLQAVHQPL